MTDTDRAPLYKGWTLVLLVLVALAAMPLFLIYDRPRGSALDDVRKSGVLRVLTVDSPDTGPHQGSQEHLRQPSGAALGSRMPTERLHGEQRPAQRRHRHVTNPRAAHPPSHSHQARPLPEASDVRGQGGEPEHVPPRERRRIR